MRQRDDARDRSNSYDLRPLVLEMQYAGETEPGWQRLLLTLRSEPSATGRVDAVLEALELGEVVSRIERQRLVFADSETT